MENSSTAVHTNALHYDLIIYHGGCPDGTAGAWCFWQALNYDNSKFYPGRFNENPPDVTGKRVLFIDFSYPLDVTREMLKSAKFIRVLDHHKTALRLQEITDSHFSLCLDMHRSGAQLAWDEIYTTYLNVYIAANNQQTSLGSSYNPLNCNNVDIYNKSGRPWFIDDIADRDLWLWTIPDSKYSTRAMFGLGYYESFENFNKLTGLSRDYFVINGKLLAADDERSYSDITRKAVDCYAVSLVNPETKWKVRVVECDHTKASDVGNKLVSDGLCDFAVMFRYEILRDEWCISLRANVNSNIDLTEIVKHFGNGGGHPKASGFTIYGKDGKNLLSIFKPVPESQRFNLYSSNNMII